MTASFYSRVFAVTVVAALGVLLAKIFTPLIDSILWAAFLAFILHPINSALRKRWRGHGGVAAATITALTPLAVLLPIVAISTAFIAQSAQLLARLRSTAQKLQLQGFDDLARIPYLGRAIGWLQSHVPLTAEQLQSWLTSGAQEVLQKAAGLSGAVFLGAANTLIGFFLMLFLLFYFLRDGERMLSHAKRLIPLATLRKEKLFSDLGAVMRAVVYGTSLTALLQGVMVGIGFAIVDLASPVVFGVLAAILAMLPVGGAALVWVPAVLSLAATGRWGGAIFLFVWGAVLSSADNVLKPMLISGRASISTLAVFLGVLGGIAAFGPIGIIAGPVLLSLAMALARFAEELHVDRGGF
jgi:predicted PurR-regulated permease PerM